LTAADFAHDVDIGEEIHLDAAEAVALASFTAAAFDVEAEAAGAVAAFARLWKHGEEFADRSEDASVGGGIGARRAADGGLIDLDDFVDLVGTEEFAMRAGRLHRTIEFLRERAIENIVDQSGFAGAGDAGDDSKQAERKSHVNIFQMFALAPRIWMALPLGLRRFSGTAMLRAPLR